jgi:hypothetical protein
MTPALDQGEPLRVVSTGHLGEGTPPETPRLWRGSYVKERTVDYCDTPCKLCAQRAIIEDFEPGVLHHASGCACFSRAAYLYVLDIAGWRAATMEALYELGVRPVATVVDHG